MWFNSLVTLDYLKEGSNDCPLLRLYDFDSAEANRLRQAFEQLADGRTDCVCLDSIRSIDGSEIVFVRSVRESGVIETKPGHFEVSLTSEGWRQAADLVEPLCDGRSGYQWLTPQTRGIHLLLSTDGLW